MQKDESTTRSRCNWSYFRVILILFSTCKHTQSDHLFTPPQRGGVWGLLAPPLNTPPPPPSLRTHTITACLQSSLWLINLLVGVVGIRGIKVAGSLQTHPAILPWGSGAAASHPLMRGHDTHTHIHTQFDPSGPAGKESLTCRAQLSSSPLPPPFLSQTPQIPASSDSQPPLVTSRLPNTPKPRGGSKCSKREL